MIGMKKKFDRLLEPGDIGKVKTRNRMIKTAAGTSFINKDGTVSEVMKNFYGSIARGGVGLVTVESCGVEYPLGVHHLSAHAHLEDDKYISGYAELTEVIHKHDCPVFIQLFHSGPWHPYSQTGLTPVSSSYLPQKERDELGVEKLHGLTIPEVEGMVEKFSAAADRARKAGFDGVEINANSNHLIHTFLSRVWNRREDEYGYADLSSRAKFLADIIKAIKSRSGEDFAISVLITGLEIGIRNGIAIEEGLEIGRIIQDAGADAIQTRAFGYKEYHIIHPGPERFLIQNPPENLPAELDWSRQGAGAFVPLAAALKKVVQVPVITVGGLDHDLGDRILEEGKADFVGFNRCLLADPELPNKVAEGRPDDISHCKACYNCWNERINNRHIRCKVNELLGK